MSYERKNEIKDSADCETVGNNCSWCVGLARQALAMELLTQGKKSDDAAVLAENDRAVPIVVNRPYADTVPCEDRQKAALQFGQQRAAHYSNEQDKRL